MQLATCVEQGWAHFKDNPVPLVLGTLVIGVVNAVLSATGRYVPLGFLLVPLVSLVLMPVLYGGLATMAVRASGRQPFDLPDIFAGFQRPLPFIVVGLASAAGALLCGVGVLVTGFLFMFAPMLVARGADFGEALVRSKDLVLANLGDAILLFLLVIAMNVGGALLFGIGLLVSLPVSFLTVVKALEQLQGAAAPAAAPWAGAP